MPSGNIKRKQFRTPSCTFLLWDSNTNWHCLTLTSVIIIVTVERVKITLSAGLHNDLTVKTKLKQKWSKARRIWTSICNEQETQEAATDWWERKVSRHCGVMQARKRAESEGRVARGAQTDPRSIGSQGGTLRQRLSYAHIYGLQLWPHLWTTYMVTEKVNLPSLLSCNLKSISHLLKWTGFLQHPTYGSLQVPRIWEHVPSCNKPLALPFLTPNLLSTLSLGSVKMILRAAQYTEIFPKEGKFLWTSYQNPAERGSPVCQKNWLVSLMICLTPCRLRQGDHGFLESQSTKWKRKQARDFLSSPEIFFFSIWTLS